MLLVQIPEGYTCCVVRGDEIVSEDLLQPKTSEAMTYADVKRVHGDKPWHIMREKEIADLLRYGYPPHEPGYVRFKGYLSRTLHLPASDVEEIISRIHRRMAYGAETEEFFEILEDHQVRLSYEQLEQMLKLFQDLNNDTPTFYNRGNTPNKMSGI